MELYTARLSQDVDQILKSTNDILKGRVCVNPCSQIELDAYISERPGLFCILLGIMQFRWVNVARQFLSSRLSGLSLGVFFMVGYDNEIYGK